jgi:hypothetical protein
MAAFIGLPELVIVAMVVVIVAFSWRASHAQVATTFADAGAAVPDSWFGAAAGERYRHGVRAGNLAELFGLAGDRLYWKQILVLVVGLTLLRNLGWLMRPELFAVLTFMTVVWMMIPDIVFVASAIIAVRSFRGSLNIACATGVMYTALVTVARSVFDASSASPENLWVPVVVSFVWAATTMAALAFSAGRRSPWLRMVIALTVASMMQSFVAVGLYAESWGPEAFLQESRRLVALVPYSGLATVAFWLGRRVRPVPVGR